MDITGEQRWRDRHSTFVLPADGVFEPTGWQVRPLDEAAARDFVRQHHYSGTWVAAQHRFGLVHDTGLLGGVCVFGVPMSARVLTNAFPDLVPFSQAVELSRLVLLDDLAFNAESWFVARALRKLKAEGIKAVISFSDPVPRVHDGRLEFAGHIGTTYKASNAAYLGRGTARTLTMVGGQVISDRSLQEVRAEERGAQYVVDRPVTAGASRPTAGTTGAQWLPGALVEAGATRLRHGGNHRDAFTLARNVALGFEQLPYPAAVDPIPQVRPVTG